MAKVYLDASFVSACITNRGDPQSIYRQTISKEWWNTQRQRHELFVSQEVIDELSDPNYPLSAQAMKWIGALPLLAIDEEVIGVAELFVKERVMPAPIAGDAIHVAVSSIFGCEYLLSWNVRHLANPNKLVHLRVICRRAGLVPPQIVTPDLLWEEQGEQP